MASLSCNIAIWYHEGVAIVGGWVGFPGAQLTFDPNSEVTLPDGSRAGYGLTHSLALQRWLPVPRDWVTPDGLAYAFVTQDHFSIGVVDRYGLERVLEPPVSTGPTDIWHLLSAQPEGIYVDRYPGLLLVGWDGTFHWITREGYWQGVSDGAAYGQLVDPSEISNAIVRLDLRSGAITRVFARDGGYSFVRGFGAGGAPVIMAEGRSIGTEIWIADATPIRIFATDTPFGVWSAVADAHGTWISTNAGICLYTPAHGFELASDALGVLASSCR